jgi:hypothetical protein
VASPTNPTSSDSAHSHTLSDDRLERVRLTGMLVGKLLGAGITAFVQVDQDTGEYTDMVKIILHDQPYEPTSVTVQVVSPTD